MPTRIDSARAHESAPPDDAPSDDMDRLVQLVYDDLREIAHRYLRPGGADPLFQTTSLVHEAYLNLRDQRDTSWKNRAHLIGIAALGMRRIVMNRIKRKTSVRGPEAYGRLALEDLDGAVGAPHEAASDLELLAVDDALAKLARVDPRKAQLVELRFFAGLTLAQASKVQGISLATARRHWAVAKLWMMREVLRELDHAT